MKRRSWLRSTALAAAAGGAFAALGDAADAQERVRWKLASSYTSNLDVLGENILRVIDNIDAMSDGNFEIQFNEPGALVPAPSPRARSRPRTPAPASTPAACPT